MSFNPEMLRSRLASSTEAADSITATAHWILFHKRHAASVAEHWAEAVTSDKNKLPEIYIANEVIQQSKIKRKHEFVDAFRNVLPNALAKAYVQSDLPTRDRIMRVIRVWRDRGIFSSEGQLQIEESIKSAGESLSSSVPSDLVMFVKHYTELKAAAANKTGIPDGLVDHIKKELGDINALIAEYSQQKPELKSPEVEPLPTVVNKAAQTKVEVYTSELAKQNLHNNHQTDVNNNNDDDDEIGYAPDSDEEEQQRSQTPPEKKQKVEVDPKLASFLASISNK